MTQLITCHTWILNRSNVIQIKWKYKEEMCKRAVHWLQVFTRGILNLFGWFYVLEKLWQRDRKTFVILRLVSVCRWNLIKKSDVMGEHFLIMETLIRHCIFLKKLWGCSHSECQWLWIKYGKIQKMSHVFGWYVRSHLAPVILNDMTAI